MVNSGKNVDYAQNKNKKNGYKCEMVKGKNGKMANGFPLWSWLYCLLRYKTYGKRVFKIGVVKNW